MSSASRRGFVKGLVGATGALALGFDPVRRSWVTKVHAQEQGFAIPDLDGALFTDPDTRAEYAEDFGHIVHHTPRAVLQPGSVGDVVKMIKFCKLHHIQVAARGQGHSTAGQSQVDDGVVIDMATLADVEELTSTHVVVGAGARWRDLLEETVPQGLQPPVLTGYTGISVGGTLSMGGIGAASFRKGAQVDNVLELHVVTGDGELKVCSPRENPLLFNAVLGGVGQYGVIVKAKLPMVAVAPYARNYVIAYGNTAQFFADMKKLTDAGKVDGVYGQLQPDGQGGWLHLIIAVKFFELASPPNDADLMAGLSFPPPALQVSDMDTLSFDTFVDSQLAFLETIGLFHIPHVWGDYFLPESKVASFVESTLAGVTPADLGPAGFVLVFPVKNRFPNVAFRLPREETAYLFDVLASGLPSDPSFAATQLPKARAVYDRARAQGGTLYPIGSTPMAQADWARHYGALYGLLLLAKNTYDPARIMTPGPGIF